MPFVRIKIVIVAVLLFLLVGNIFSLYSALLFFPVASFIRKILTFIWIIILANLIEWTTIVIYRMIKAKEDTPIKDIFP